MLEVVEELEALSVGRGAVDERLVEGGGVVAQGKHVVTEHQHLVAPRLVQADKAVVREHPCTQHVAPVFALLGCDLDRPHLDQAQDTGG